ncbi:MAG: DUF4465 domain-containing protein [Bacteroidota bacterium]
MNKFTLFMMFLFGTAGLFAQTTADFEDLSVPVDSFFNGSDGSGGFSSGNVFLPNSYNSMFSSWSGWSVSTKGDTVTAGLSNQYSSVPGIGAEGSATFAVANMFNPGILEITNNGTGKQVEGMYITNATYVYRSLLEGDMFAKKFGGETGDDPDFFLLTIKAYKDGNLSTDSVDFYLADYRFADNTQDYIVKEWTWLDLTGLGDADSLVFDLSSSDSGQFGMNTPAYFCMDNFTTRNFATSIEPAQALNVRFYPNPAQTQITVDWDQFGTAEAAILNLQGTIVRRSRLEQGSNQISVADLSAGIYLLQVNSQEGSSTQRFVKQ